jgi:UDP-N-acetylmuramate dehydrogenase
VQDLGIQPLSGLTTLRVGGPTRVIQVDDVDDLVASVRELDDAGTPVLVLGGGSNLVPSDEGFAGATVLVASRGATVEHADTCGGIILRVAAGHPWDELVADAVESGWVGIEALSGIPGSTGATPLQNVGAYGQEVADTVARVRVYDRERRAIRTVMHADCGFGYRTSRFRHDPRFVVLDVTFQFRLGSVGEPVRYAQLADTLGVAVGERAPSRAVREAVLELRRAKGMVLDEDDHDTWSTGSFFTNPVLAAADVPAGAPRWPQPDGTVKTSAAWLIEQAGFARGYPGDGAPVTVSTKHTLALTNRGQARASDVVALARAVRRGVLEQFGVLLEPEPVLVGVSLD